VTATVMWLGVLAGIVTGLLTGLIRDRALRRGVLDLPNERSSHSTATPRGGGAAIVLVVSAAALLLQWLGALPSGLSAVLLGGGLAVALVGFLDDRRTLPPGVRFAVHLVAAAWALWWLGGLPPLRLGAQVVNLGWPGQALALAGIVWVLNLFNFMDGIDGIAAAEAVFVSLAGTMLGLLVGTAPGVPAFAWIFAAACAGFLFWNWPPARIFMGDVGSGYLGYVIAVFALAASHSDAAAVWVWLILGGVFFADATLTLVRRGARGERVHEAHRTHAYQHFARRWKSHRHVTLAVSAVNLLWLLPCAALAAMRPAYAAWLVLVALVPLAALAFAAGAGARDEP
jgi:Fuc2NAc and GlcNAc transferase